MKISKLIALIFVGVCIVACKPNSSKDTTTPAETPVTATDSISAGQAPEPQIATQNLRWKNVSVTEFGPSYIFEDEDGNEIYYNYIEFSGFEMDNNEYFTTTRYDDRALPELKLKEGIKDKWFKIKLQPQMRESSGSGETLEVDVIVGIEPLQ